MKLGIVYHMPFWRAADGTLREVEGSFARYVDSLAPYFDEISLCAPALGRPSGEGTAIRSSNVTLAPLASFLGPAQFYPKLPVSLPRLAGWVRGLDVLHCRVDCFDRHGPLEAGKPNAARHLVAVVVLAPAILLHDHEADTVGALVSTVHV